jgi:hypothetical protein
METRERANTEIPGDPIMRATGCRVGAHAFVKISTGTAGSWQSWEVCGCGAMCYDGVPKSVQRWWSREGDGPWIEHRS